MLLGVDICMTLQVVKRASKGSQRGSWAGLRLLPVLAPCCGSKAAHPCQLRGPVAEGQAAAPCALHGPGCQGNTHPHILWLQYHCTVH